MSCTTFQQDTGEIDRLDRPLRLRPCGLSNLSISHVPSRKVVQLLHMYVHIIILYSGAFMIDRQIKEHRVLMCADLGYSTGQIYQHRSPDRFTTSSLLNGDNIILISFSDTTNNYKYLYIA